MAAQKKACDACHKRKIHCDYSESSGLCNWCQHHRLSCTFDRVRGRRKKTKARSESKGGDALVERLERIESTLARAIALQDRQSGSSASQTSTPASSSSNVQENPLIHATYQIDALRGHVSYYTPRKLAPISVPLPGTTTAISFGQLYHAGVHLGQLSHANGLPILSDIGVKWIADRTGEKVWFERFHQFSEQQRSRAPTLLAAPGLNGGVVTDLYGLPDREITTEAAALYFNCAFGQAFPILDPALFPEIVDDAYQPLEGKQYLRCLSARACLLAMLALAHHFGARIPGLNTDSCAAKAHMMLSFLYEDTGLNTLQTALLLCIHQKHTGCMQSASMLHSLSCRIILTIGAHSERSMEPYGTEISREDREIRHQRLLFWLCYMFDKDLALRNGHPPLMTDDYCDTSFPDDYQHYGYERDSDANFPQKPDELPLYPHLPGDLRLARMKEKITRVLYSAHAVKKSDAELLRDIRELDDELESWRLTIMPDFRPVLSISDESQVRVYERIHHQRIMRISFLHLEYHHIMTTIHRAIHRCRSVNPESEEYANVWQGGFKSSIALSLEASRSTIVFLRASIRGMPREAYWVLMFYPYSAILTVFFNVLLNPLEPDSDADMKLLHSASDLMHTMPLSELSTHELDHISMVNDFVDELVRLGHCAIAKAHKEGGSQSCAAANH